MPRESVSRPKSLKILTVVGNPDGTKCNWGLKKFTQGWKGLLGSDPFAGFSHSLKGRPFPRLPNPELWAPFQNSLNSLLCSSRPTPCISETSQFALSGVVVVLRPLEFYVCMCRLGRMWRLERFLKALAYFATVSPKETQHPERRARGTGCLSAGKVGV